MTLAIRLTPDLEQRLTALAKLTGRTKTYYVREALQRTLEDMEDLYVALYRLEHPGKRWSMEEVERECGLESGVDHRVGGRRRKGVQKARPSRPAENRPVS